MRSNKLLQRFHKGQTLLFVNEKMKNRDPFTTKISLWKTSSGSTKMMIEKFYDKYYEANDLYEKDEITEYPSIDIAFEYLSKQYNVRLEQFE